MVGAEEYHGKHRNTLGLTLLKGNLGSKPLIGRSHGYLRSASWKHYPEKGGQNNTKLPQAAASQGGGLGVE